MIAQALGLKRGASTGAQYGVWGLAHATCARAAAPTPGFPEGCNPMGHVTPTPKGVHTTQSANCKPVQPWTFAGQFGWRFVRRGIEQGRLGNPPSSTPPSGLVRQGVQTPRPTRQHRLDSRVSHPECTRTRQVARKLFSI